MLLFLAFMTLERALKNYKCSGLHLELPETLVQSLIDWKKRPNSQTFAEERTPEKSSVWNQRAFHEPAILTLKWWPGCFYFERPLEISRSSWIVFFNMHESFSRYAQTQTKDELKQTALWPLTTARLQLPAQRRMFVSLDTVQARWLSLGDLKWHAWHTHMHVVTATYYRMRTITSQLQKISLGSMLKSTSTLTWQTCTLWSVWYRDWQPSKL